MAVVRAGMEGAAEEAAEEGVAMVVLRAGGARMRADHRRNMGGRGREGIGVLKRTQ